MSLLMVHVLRHLEVHEVPVVVQDLYGVPGPFQDMYGWGLACEWCSCVIWGATWEVQKYSSSSGVNFLTGEVSRWSTTIRQGFGKWMKVLGAVVTSRKLT